MKVYILFEDFEDYDEQSAVIDIYADEKKAISDMEGLILKRASHGSWTYKQVSETKWVRNGREGEGFHVEPWEVVE